MEAVSGYDDTTDCSVRWVVYRSCGRGRGGSNQGAEKGGYDIPGSEGTARAGTPYRDREATPQRERGGAVQEYGTRYGACNNCGEEGHYAYECKKPPRKNAPARHTS